VFQKSRVSKAVAFLLVIVLVWGFALGTAALADGGGGQPFPPTETTPLPASSNGGSSFFLSLLTVLQLVL